MAIILDRDQGLLLDKDEQIGLECPYCNTYSHMSPQSVPGVDDLLRHRPKHVGLVYRCNACSAPVFLRFAIKQFGEDRVELYRNFVELERPKERFAFSYLPKDTDILFREALSCYSGNNFNAFASMCRRSASSAYEALGEGGRLRAFEEIVIAQDIAGISSIFSRIFIIVSLSVFPICFTKRTFCDVILVSMATVLPDFPFKVV